MSDYDIEFFWDRVCPRAWLTSPWVAEVAGHRDLHVWALGPGEPLLERQTLGWLSFCGRIRLAGGRYVWRRVRGRE